MRPEARYRYVGGREASRAEREKGMAREGDMAPPTKMRRDTCKRREAIREKGISTSLLNHEKYEFCDRSEHAINPGA
jgi:hypothetical protein